MSVGVGRASYWVSRQFKNESIIRFANKSEAGANDIDFIGGRLAVQTNAGDIWEWMIVDYQADEVLALPFRPKDLEKDGNGGIVMSLLGKDEYMGQRDRS